jgi:hypothetical protein
MDHASEITRLENDIQVLRTLVDHAIDVEAQMLLRASAEVLREKRQRLAELERHHRRLRAPHPLGLEWLLEDLDGLDEQR